MWRSDVAAGRATPPFAALDATGPEPKGIRCGPRNGDPPAYDRRCSRSPLAEPTLVALGDNKERSYVPVISTRSDARRGAPRGGDGAPPCIDDIAHPRCGGGAADREGERRVDRGGHRIDEDPDLHGDAERPREVAGVLHDQE